MFGATSGQPLRVYMSYARADSADAERLTNALLSVGVSTLLDRTLYPDSQSLPQSVVEAIAASNAVVASITPAALDSPAFARELQYAAQLGKPILNVLLRPVNLTPEQLATMRPINFVANEQLGFQQLWGALGQLGAQPVQFAQPGQPAPQAYDAPGNAPTVPGMTPVSGYPTNAPTILSGDQPGYVAPPGFIPPGFGPAAPLRPDVPPTALPPTAPGQTPAFGATNDPAAYAGAPYWGGVAPTPQGGGRIGNQPPARRSLSWRIILSSAAAILVVAMLSAVLVTIYQHQHKNGGATTGRHTGTPSATTLPGQTPVSSPTPNGLPFDQQIIKASLTPGSQDIATLDPAVTVDNTSFQAEQLIFPSLVTLDANLNIIPWAITGLPAVSPDGLTYTFHLRSGMQWSDGTPITAGTFAYSLNRALDPCTGSGGAGFYLAAIQGATAFNSGQCSAPSGSLNPADNQSLIGKSLVVADQQTLVIKLAQPVAYFLAELTTPAAMAVPQQIVTQYGLAHWTDHLVGFGGNMFELKLWGHNGTLDVVQNPTFFGGKTRVKEIDFSIYQDTNTEWSAYLADQVMIGSVSTAQYPSAKNRADVHVLPNPDMGYIQPNWATAPFDNLSVRQAFELALNKEALANNVLNGTVIASNHMVPLGQPGYNPNLKGVDNAPFTGDQTKATQLINQYAQQHCGGAVANCPPVQFWSDNSASSVALANAIMGMWQSALPGYPISLHTTTFTSLLTAVIGRTPSARPQLYLIGYFADYPDPQDWTSLQATPTANNNNYGSINDSRATALMNAADVDQNAADRIAKYQQAEQLLVQDVGWITLDQGKQLLAYSPKLIGYTSTASGFPTYQTWLTMYLSA